MTQTVIVTTNVTGLLSRCAIARRLEGDGLDDLPVRFNGSHGGDCPKRD